MNCPICGSKGVAIAREKHVHDGEEWSFFTVACFQCNEFYTEPRGMEAHRVQAWPCAYLDRRGDSHYTTDLDAETVGDRLRRAAAAIRARRAT